MEIFTSLSTDFSGVNQKLQIIPNRLPYGKKEKDSKFLGIECDTFYLVLLLMFCYVFCLDFGLFPFEIIIFCLTVWEYMLLQLSFTSIVLLPAI